jgi:hypothetical protein
MSKTSRRLLGLVYAPLRQWRGLDTISPQDLVVDNIMSSPESSSAELEKANRGRLDELGLGFEHGEVVVVSLDGTLGGESSDLQRFLHSVVGFCLVSSQLVLLRSEDH